MRKLKNDKFSTKVENNLDKFYMGYLTDEKIKEFSMKIDGHCKKNKKHVSAMVTILKKAIDKYYTHNKVESKYVYFSNLYEIYDMLCLYFYKNSKFAKLGEGSEKKMKIVGFTSTELFGYQTAFSEKVDKKITDVMSRLYTIVSESTLRYINPIKPKNKKILETQLANILSREKIISTKEKAIRKEIAYLNGILNRIKFTRENIALVSLEVNKANDDDLRIRKNIKGTLTRLENALNLIIQEI